MLDFLRVFVQVLSKPFRTQAQMEAEDLGKRAEGGRLEGDSGACVAEVNRQATDCANAVPRFGGDSRFLAENRATSPAGDVAL
ncbi:MAG: hypothetical protein JO339_30715 [Alphaproteobacteria bacterium]|nr:hypothetical protein [Alphaproteobacteria bacterium]